VSADYEPSGKGSEQVIIGTNQLLAATVKLARQPTKKTCPKNQKMPCNDNWWQQQHGKQRQQQQQHAAH